MDDKEYFSYLYEIASHLNKEFSLPSALRKSLEKTVELVNLETGWIDDGYRMRIISGLLTGFHEPRASHLNMLQSLAGFDHIERAYNSTIENNYFWHQFGDFHLILPGYTDRLI